MHHLAHLAALAVVLSLAACGGGSASPASSALSAAPQTAATAEADDPNALPVVVDPGPPLFLLTGRKVVNMLFASVTLCTPGSGSACETIDHVQVDTGSVGLRILAPALTGTAALRPLAEPATGSPLRECVQFADGYTWGSVAIADVRIGGRTIGSLPVNLIADPAAGSAPSTCVSGPPKNTVTAFGSNGVLGIGSFLQDCGAPCVAGPVSGMYYVCPSAGSGNLCRPTAVPLERQVPNPVAALGSDNNGVTIAIPAVPRTGATRVSGKVYFGVDTQANNALGGAQLLTVDARGTMLTRFDGRSQPAIVDSGSNGYFFASTSIDVCAKNKAFYCPTTGGVPASLAQTATIVGRNGVGETVEFSVDNVDQLFSGQAALPGVAAPSAGLVGGAATVFSWGLPFFYGRTVHVLFENSTVNGVSGPAVAF